MILVDDTNIKIDGIWLHGMFKSIEINADALIEEQEVEGSSRKPKQATGYEDSKVNIVITLYDSPKETKKQKLEIIQNLFRKQGQEKPTVHQLIHPVAALRGVKDVVINSMKTKEVNSNDSIEVTLELMQYEPVKITTVSNSEASYQPPIQDYQTPARQDKKRIPGGALNSARSFIM